MIDLENNLKKECRVFLAILKGNQDPQYGIERIIESLEEFYVNTRQNIIDNQQHLIEGEISSLYQFIENYRFVKCELINFREFKTPFDKVTSINLIFESYNHYQKEFFEIQDTLSEEEKKEYIDTILFPFVLIMEFIKEI